LRPVAWGAGRRRRRGHVLGLLLGLLAAAGTAPARTEDLRVPYPDTDRPWTSVDYRDLAERIVAGRVPLPTLAEPAARRAFERMVSLDNLAVVRNKSAPIASRVPEMLAMISATRTLMLGYLDEAKRGRPYERELARLQVYTLAQASLVVALVDEFLPTVKKDANYEARMAGLGNIRSALRSVTSGTVESTTDTRFFSKASTLEQVAGLERYLPVLHRILVDEDRRELLARVEDATDKATDDEIRAALVRLEGALRNVRK
jgi:hypothetical protein